MNVPTPERDMSASGPDGSPRRTAIVIDPAPRIVACATIS
jgi:hypothetical protein